MENDKVLITLHGMWPIPIHDSFDPIELEDGISLVSIVEKEHPSISDLPDDLVVSLHKKGDINVHPFAKDFPLSKLPRMGMLFESQKKEKDGLLYMPHKYVAASMRPKTILRLFKSGEFITSLIINAFSFDICTPISDSPDLLYYEITLQNVEPMKKFCRYLSEKWKEVDRLLTTYKGSVTMKNLYNRMNNAIQFLDKSYFDEFAFSRQISPRQEDVSRADNYLRLIFCWMGIESLVCVEKFNKTEQLKNTLPKFLTEYGKDQITKFVDTYYDMRSVYIHANPLEMMRILNKDLNRVRDVLKLLILTYMIIASDESIYKDLNNNVDIDPITHLKSQDLSRYYKEMKNDSGADFNSYSF